MDNKEETFDWAPIPDPDECSAMTIEEFIGHLRSTGIMSSDGFGCYATAEHMDESREVHFKEEKVRAMAEKYGFTHVVWYNK